MLFTPDANPCFQTTRSLTKMLRLSRQFQWYPRTPTHYFENGSHCASAACLWRAWEHRALDKFWDLGNGPLFWHSVGCV